MGANALISLVAGARAARQIRVHGKKCPAFSAHLNRTGSSLAVLQAPDVLKGPQSVIKVDGTRPLDNVRSARAKPASSSGGTFAPAFADETRQNAPVSASSPLSGVDALIALQAMADPLSGREKAARRGRDMLDLLDELRAGLLEGQVSRSTLNSLTALVNVQREDFVDPHLSSVLDEIDLRARVELAKLTFATAK